MDRVYSYSKIEQESKKNQCKSWLASCASHTMHRFTVQIKKKVNFIDDYFKNFAIFCFSLLLNCTTLNASTIIFQHMVQTFCQEYTDEEVINSIDILKTFIEERPDGN